MNVFKIDWHKLAKLLLPAFLRKERTSAFLYAAIKPVQDIYFQFENTRAETEFLLKYDTSKRNVEIALRKRFNNEGIFITNAPKGEGLVLPFYLDSYITMDGYETPIKYTYLEQYLPFCLGEEQSTPEFIIHVPETLYITNAQAIYDFASLFVLPSFRYKLQRY